MNYIIISEMRTGSSFVGDLLAAHDIPYFNELFTGEMCRRSNVLPQNLDGNISNAVLEQVWSVPDAGFKIIYNQATPAVWAALIQAQFVKVIHLVRDDLIEQYCSIQYLERVGVSSYIAGECRGTDGCIATPDLDFAFTIDLVHFARWCRDTIDFRRFVWWAFRESHEYIELQFPLMFEDEGARSLLKFVAPDRRFLQSTMTNHQPTPRPKAHDMAINFDSAKELLESIQWERGV